MKKTNDWNVVYAIFRFWVKITFRKFYYREVCINNFNNVPQDCPVLFAPNHQNSLMDPLCVPVSIKRQPFFLARQDFFKSKIIIYFFTLFKMLPVYRMRDGYGNLRKNEEIFKKCANVLSRNNCLVIMPEGNHGEGKRLRSFGKGVVRVALASEEIHNNKLDLKIVPVGIEYKDVKKFRSRLLINFGKPISVSDYYELYSESNQKGFKALNEKIREELIQVMIHIETEEIHDLLVRLRDIYNPRMREKLNISDTSYLSVFKADKKMVEIFEESHKVNPEKSDFLSKTTKDYFKGLKILNLRDNVLSKKHYSFFRLLFSFLILLLLMPFQIIGLINNYLPYKIPVLILNRAKIDKQFYSSLCYGLSFMLLFPLFYAIIFIILLLITGNILIALAYLTIAGVSGLFAIHYWFHLKKFIARLKFNRLIKNNDPEILDLLEKRKQIFQTTDEIIDSYLK